MTVIVIGYTKDFSFLPFLNVNEKYVYESMSDRIDYIRSTNLNKKENFTLIPKFINGESKKIVVHLEKNANLPLKSFKNKNKLFLHVQKLPFYNSRQIEVTGIRLEDLNVIFDKLVINYGDIEDIIKSAGSRIYQFKEIYIKKDIETKRDKKFLETYFFKEDFLISDDTFSIYKNESKELNIKRYTSISELEGNCNIENCIYLLVPEQKKDTYLPLYNYNTNLKTNTLYLDNFNERLTNTIIFGNYSTMNKLKELLIENPRKFIITTSLGNYFKLERFKV